MIIKKLFILKLGAPNIASNKALLSSKKKQDPNPLLDVPMSCLQKTNTRLETLEVVERAGGLTSHHTTIGIAMDGKKDDILNATQLSTFNFQLSTFNFQKDMHLVDFIHNQFSKLI